VHRHDDTQQRTGELGHGMGPSISIDDFCDRCSLCHHHLLS
jgi:hypothetical protein